jgi:hypothetical protein
MPKNEAQRSNSRWIRAAALFRMKLFTGISTEDGDEDFSCQMMLPIMLFALSWRKIARIVSSQRRIFRGTSPFKRCCLLPHINPAPDVPSQTDFLSYSTSIVPVMLA